MEALGLIELYGCVPAVEAQDAALKAANVKLHSFTRVRGGLVTVTVTGEVAAVQAAMDAACSGAGRVGQVLSVHVIPRPADGVDEILDETGKRGKERKPKERSLQKTDPESNTEENSGPTKAEVGELSMAELEALPVVKLRAAARDMKLDTLTKREIRDAKKDELIKAICAFREREV